MKKENLYGIYSCLALLILLFFPFYIDNIESFSLLSLKSGKIFAFIIILIAISFFKDINENYRNILISISIIWVLKIVLESYLEKSYTYNYSTISLILLAFSIMCYFGFSKNKKIK